MTSLSFHDFYCRSVDGLKLHARTIGSDDGGRLPVLCLPGLTRTAEDFDAVAQALATSEAGRRVVAVDYRGRGLSDYDADPKNYQVPIEANDVLTLAAAAGIKRAIVLGTSRGGLIGMALAATKPDFVAGLLLNDIGPELEIEGLMKIKGYIKDLPPRTSWDDAADGLKGLFGDVFPLLTNADWMAWARRAFREDGLMLVRTYDPKLAHAFDSIDRANPPQPLWDLFDRIADIPLGVIRGQLSDLLSWECVQKMQSRRPDMSVWEVPDQGHAPLLDDAPSIEHVTAFCARCDAARTE
jgi:pimeloyl-ACP methyl ester carboxylesterase